MYHCATAVQEVQRARAFYIPIEGLVAPLGAVRGRPQATRARESSHDFVYSQSGIAPYSRPLQNERHSGDSAARALNKAQMLDKHSG
jgi:hypothetical protein